jgi:hypothetical protein
VWKRRDNETEKKQILICGKGLIYITFQVSKLISNYSDNHSYWKYVSMLTFFLWRHFEKQNLKRMPIEYPSKTRIRKKEGRKANYVNFHK